MNTFSHKNSSSETVVTKAIPCINYLSASACTKTTKISCPTLAKVDEYQPHFHLQIFHKTDRSQLSTFHKYSILLENSLSLPDGNMFLFSLNSNLMQKYWIKDFYERKKSLLYFVMKLAAPLHGIR